MRFLPIIDSTVAGFYNTNINKLTSWNLDIQNIRRQGYDNGANMRGKKNRLQKLILNKNPRAFFVPCPAHSLNLVVSDTAKINFETIGFFGTIQAIYNFFTKSVKRWSVPKSHITSLTLKPLCESVTRWESRINALKPLRHQREEIYNALYEVFIDENFDQESRHEEQILCSKLKDYQFLCCLISWYDILLFINSISEMLQKVLYLPY